MSKFYNTKSTNGYLVYRLDGIDPSITPVIQFGDPSAATSNASTYYLIPKLKTIDSIKKDPNDNLDNYLLKPLVSPTGPNSGSGLTLVYGIRNKCWESKLLWVHNPDGPTHTTPLDTYNSSNQNSLTWNFSNAWSEKIVSYNSNVQTSSMVPTALCPPFVTIGGYPLITLSEYFSLIPDLLPITVPNNPPVQQCLLVDSPLVYGPTSVLSESQVTSIVTSYKNMLSYFSTAADTSDADTLKDMYAQLSSLVTQIRNIITSNSSTNSSSAGLLIETQYGGFSFDNYNQQSATFSILPVYAFQSNDLENPVSLISAMNNGATGGNLSGPNFVYQYWRGNQPWIPGEHYPSWLLLHGSYNQESWNTWSVNSWFPSTKLFTGFINSSLFGVDVPAINNINPASWGFTINGFAGSSYMITGNQQFPGTFVSAVNSNPLSTDQMLDSVEFFSTIRYNNFFTGIKEGADICSLQISQATSLSYLDKYGPDLASTIFYMSSEQWQQIIADPSNASVCLPKLEKAYADFFLTPCPLIYGTNSSPQFFYNLIWDSYSEYIGAQGASVNFYASTITNLITYLSADSVSTSVTVRSLDIKIKYLKNKSKASDDYDDLTKLAQGYYSCADLMVSSYYNHALQKVNYILTDMNQVSNPTLLQRMLAIAVKYNYLRELLSEWVNGHPFKSEPSITSQMRDAVNVSASNFNYTESDSLDAINEFINTTLPGSLNAYDLDDSIKSNLMVAQSNFIQASNNKANFIDFSPVTYITPQVFRDVIKKVMGMGAFLDLVHPHLTSLNILEHALKTQGYTINSNPQSPDNVGVLPSVMSNSQVDYNNSIGSSQITQASYSVEDHVSSNLRPLIYPLFTDVIDEIMSDVRHVREIAQDRLHGMQYAVYQPELKAIFERRIRLTHSLIHYFTLGVHSIESFISPITNIAGELNHVVGESIDNLILKPISHVLVAIAKFAVSALLDMTSLVAPGSEILRLIDDAAILRPIPSPLTPFMDVDNDASNVNKNALFYNAVVNGTSGNAILSSYECIVPWYGLASRYDAAKGVVIYNSITKSYRIELPAPSNSIVVNSVTNLAGAAPDNPLQASNADNGASSLILRDVTPGLHCQSLFTTAGVVDMWYSIDYTVSHTTGSVVLSPEFASWNVGQAALGDNIITMSGILCFIPRPVVEIDGRISLTKTIHKWCMCGLALPGLFFKGSQTSSYIHGVKSLEQIPGFDNLTSHIATSTEAACATADAAAGTFACAYSLIDILDFKYTSQTQLEGFAVAAEDFSNIARVTTIYLQSNSVNVMNSVVNGQTSDGLTVEDILVNAWPSVTSEYSLEYYNLFEDTVINNPNNNIPAWYGQSWGRLLGDVLMGIAKLAYFLHAQHKVFKKWSQTADQPKQQKVTALGKLETMLKNKWSRHKTVAGVMAGIDKLNHSFLGSKDVSGLHSFELSNTKSIRSMLSDDSSMMKSLTSLTSSLSGLRGIN